MSVLVRCTYMKIGMYVTGGTRTIIDRIVRHAPTRDAMVGPHSLPWAHDLREAVRGKTNGLAQR